MRLLILRPRAQGEDTLRQVEARGHSGLVMPMVEIAPLVSAIPELAGLRDVGALLITSTNGLRIFEVGVGRFATVPVYCVGQATAERAEALGFRTVLSAHGDGEALLALVRAQAPKGQLVHVSGDEVRVDLAERLTALGYSARRIVAYATIPRPHLPEDVTADQFDGVLITSQQIAAAFALCVAGIAAEDSCDHPWRDLDYFCISDAAAAGLQPFAPQKVWVAPRPNMASMLDMVSGT